MAEGEADEIYWVNKLLTIEDMDWSCQLSQAVSILLLSQNLHFQKILTLVTFPYNLQLFLLSGFQGHFPQCLGPQLYFKML